MKDPTHIPIHADKRNFLFIILSGIFITNALIAEVIGVKIFSLENLLDLPPAQIPLMEDLVLDFNLTAGVLIWPVVFITTDIINEYFGEDAVRKISIIAAILIAYGFIAIFITTKLPPATFWLEVNNAGQGGQPFDINYSYSRIFRQGLSIIIGSLTAFLIGQLLDAYIFHRIRRITKTRLLWLRATGSTIVSQFVDSFVVLFIAFYLLADEGKWSLSQVISVGIINYIYKFGIAVLLTPLLYLAHSVIDRYLGLKLSEELVNEAEEI